MSEIIELLEIAEENYPALYCAGGLKPFIEQALLEAEELKREVSDVRTDKGRKAISKAASKISKSKTAITSPSADYIRVIKAQGAAAAKEVSDFKSAMDSIRDDVKAPLIEWQASEKLRIDKLHWKIDLCGNLCARTSSDGAAIVSSELIGNREQLSAMEFDADEFGDLHQQAMETWSQSLEFLDAAIKERLALEEALAESERLKAEIAEKDKQAEIKQAAADATAKASQDAANAIAEANAKAERAEQDAMDRLEAEQKIKNDALKAKAKLESDRAENLEHRKAVNNTTMNELMQCCDGLTDTQAKKLITNFVNKKFTHITINY